MKRTWNRALDLAIPEDVGDELDRLARDSHRRTRDQAELLLCDAIRRAGQDGDGSMAGLVANFEAEGQRCFRSMTGWMKSQPSSWRHSLVSSSPSRDDDG